MVSFQLYTSNVLINGQSDSYFDRSVIYQDGFYQIRLY